jgi:hypothetical protein
MKMTQLLPMLMTVGFLGCTGSDRNKATEPTNAAPAQTTSAGQVIDGLTGRTSVRLGQQAKDNVMNISAEHNRQLDEIDSNK